MKMVTEHLKKRDLERAADLLKRGFLVAFPTETVYGLGAPIYHPQAIEEIFRVKGRPADNPLIAHVSDFSQIERLTQEIPPYFFLLAEHFFPGPLTLVLKRSLSVPSIVSAGLPSIALRMPAHPLARELISLVGQPLVAPSANTSGRPSSTSAEHVLEDFNGKIAAVLDGGKTDYGIESTVVSLLEEAPVLLRPGAISRLQIEEVLQRPLLVAKKGDGVVHSPGMKYRHYAPQTKVRLFSDLSELRENASLFSSKKKMLLSRCTLDLSFTDHFTLTAKDFYAHLRYADKSNYEEIWILCDNEVQQDIALTNRIMRSAGE